MAKPRSPAGLTPEQRAAGWTSSDDPGGHDDRLVIASRPFKQDRIAEGIDVLMGGPLPRDSLDA